MNLSKESPVKSSRFFALNAPGPMQQIKLDDLSLAVYDSGHRGVIGPPIVLLHGLGEHAGYWSENVPSLIAARRRVIIFDLAGHGRSDKPRREYSMSWHASLITQALDHLKISDPVVLVGHSMGGHIALRLAQRSPERVHSLVLISPAGIERFTGDETAWLSKMSSPAAIGSRTPSELSAHFKRNIFGQWGRVAEEHLNERLTLNDDPRFMDYIHAVVASINGMLQDRIAYELASIKTPTFLLFGAEDRLIPNPYLHGGRAQQIAELAQTELPNLQESVILPDIGHMPQIEAPRRVERMILRATKQEENLHQQGSSDESKKETKPTPQSTYHKQRGTQMKTTLIKRYPNRRLYDTERSAYITLDDLADDLTKGVRVKVIDSKTEAVITQKVILQALLTDKHAHKLDCLPLDFLQTLIQLEDPTMRSLFSHYVRVTLSSFSLAQSTMQQNIDLLKRLAPNPSDFIQSIAGIIKPSDRS